MIKKHGNLGKKRLPFSDEWRKNMSKSQIGNKHLLGKKFSKETREKMSKTAKLLGRHPPNNKGKKFTEEHRHNLSEALKGDKSYSWKGGITPENKRIRNSLEYKLWRKAVFKRDNYTCIWCKSKNGEGRNIILNADHIKTFSEYPELRFVIDNGRTLCLDCHKKTDSYKKKYVRK